MRLKNPFPAQNLHSTFVNRVSHPSFLSRTIVTSAPQPKSKVELLPPPRILSLKQDFGIDPLHIERFQNHQLSLKSAHPIYTAPFQSNKRFLKPLGKNKEFPVSENIYMSGENQAYNMDRAAKRLFSGVKIENFNDKQKEIIRKFIKDECNRFSKAFCIFLPEVKESEATAENIAFVRRKLELANARILVEKEHLYTNIARALYNKHYVPETHIVVDDHDNPQEYFLSSKELPFYKSLFEVSGISDIERSSMSENELNMRISEGFYAGPGGRTYFRGSYYDESKGIVPLNAQVSGRIWNDKLRLLLGERDANPNNSGIVLIIRRDAADNIIKGLDGKPIWEYKIGMIDLGCCGGRVTLTPVEIALKAPHSIVGALTMPEDQMLRLERRAIVKQEIFDRCASVTNKQLVMYVDQHHCNESQVLFPDLIKIEKSNLCEGFYKYMEAGEIHKMACKAMLKITDTPQISK